MEFVQTANNPAPEGAQAHWIDGERGIKLRVLTAPAARTPARGSVVICPGYTEFIEKYFEVARELQTRGFCVAIIDWRGQGLSQRALPNPLKAHFSILDDAPRDLGTIVSTLADALPRPRLILAHSMGGAISLRALQLGLVEIDAAAFSAPMWGVKANPVARGAAPLLAALGFGKSFVPGASTKWQPEDWRNSTVTQDQARHERNTALVEAEPRLAIAGPTVAWAANALKTVAGFARRGALDHVTIPILVAIAGREMLVDNRALRRVAAALPSAETLDVPEAKHEILQERDESREKFWTAFDAFAARVAP